MASALAGGASARDPNDSDPSARDPHHRDTNDLWGPDWPTIRQMWSLDPTRAHLNHGSYGAVPRRVRQEQDRWRAVVDENPMRYYRSLRDDAVEGARQAAAKFLGTTPSALALVPNATVGISTTLAALAPRAGEEIILTDHTYGAMALAARRVAAAAGAQVVTVEVPLVADDDEVVRRIAARMSARTRIVLLDHITSPTARLFPVREVAEVAHAHGALMVVDGAHVPGMLDVDVESLGADVWVGNFHKWAFALRSVAALWVAPHLRTLVRPLVVSWNDNQDFPAPFDVQGTLDDSPWLTLPEALRCYEDLGADRLRQHNAALVAYGQETLASALRVSLSDVVGDPRLSMRLVPLPPGVAETEAQAAALYERLATRLAAETAVVRWSGRGWLRLSAQVYNAPGEYERLGQGLAELLG